MSGLKTSTDKDGKSESSSFKTGDTIYARATIANNPGKVKVKFTLMPEDVKGMTKGESIKNAETSVDLDGDGVATFSLPINPAIPGGTYKINADMINDAGEKKDSKSANFTVTAAPKPEQPTEPADTDSDSDQ
jgi:hypothetical protein